MKQFSPYMRIAFVLALVILAGLFGKTAIGADYFRYDYDISGKIIDAENGQPIQGIVVSAVWFTENFRLTIEPEKKYYDYDETLTGKDGRFTIPGKGRNIFRNMPPPQVAIFKAGYGFQHLQDLGEHFKRDNPLSEKVKWIDGAPVIPFAKKNLAQRKHYLDRHPRFPFSSMDFVHVAPEKVHLFTDELKRAYEMAGMMPTQFMDPRILRVKEGGVYPATEQAIRPKSGPRQ